MDGYFITFCLGNVGVLSTRPRKLDYCTSPRQKRSAKTNDQKGIAMFSNERFMHKTLSLMLNDRAKAP